MLLAGPNIKPFKDSRLRIQLIETEWRIFASVNKAKVGLDNGLSPDRAKG